MRFRSLFLTPSRLLIIAGLAIGSLTNAAPAPAESIEPGEPGTSQEARRRWEVMAQIRRDKFDYILPEAMRENAIDMWITVMREGLHDPLYEDLGRGYVGGARECAKAALFSIRRPAGTRKGCGPARSSFQALS